MFKVINGGKMPTRATKYSACVDLYANADLIIGSGETAVIPLGVCVDFDLFNREQLGINACKTDKQCERIFKGFLKSHYLQLEPRSSIRAKGLQAGTGIIDLDFNLEICLILSNPTKVKYSHKSGELEVVSSDYKISKGDKIAQIMLCEHKSFLFGIDSDEERIGGFGSSGK